MRPASAERNTRRSRFGNGTVRGCNLRKCRSQCGSLVINDRTKISPATFTLGLPSAKVNLRRSPSGTGVPRHIDDVNPLVTLGQQERP